MEPSRWTEFVIFAGLRRAAGRTPSSGVVRLSAPRHRAERRAGTGTPTSGRHSPPQAGGSKDPEFRGGSPLGRDPGVQRHPGDCVVHASGRRRGTRLAALRAAVPTGGRRSRASASSFPAGVRAETGVIRDLGDTPFRCALRSGADRRSAVPCQRVILSRWGTCRDGRHPGTGRYAVSRPCGPLPTLLHFRRPLTLPLRVTKFDG